MGSLQILYILTEYKAHNSIWCDMALSGLKEVQANCSWASLLHTQIHTPRHAWEHALSNKMNNDRADGHCYSVAWI